MTIPFHPYADVFNLIAGSEFEQLVEDVRKHGLRDRIVLYDGMILDGRNRYRAAIAAGLLSEDDDPDDRPAHFQRFVSAVDGDPIAFVISKNIFRRHLTVAQRSYAMAEVETFRHGGAREQDANLQLDRASRAELAERAGVSERSIASAAVVRDHGVAELKAAVKRGEVSISAAEQIARRPEEDQQAEVARLPNGARSIMSSRQEPDDSLDYFPTPPWATRALMQSVLPHLGVARVQSAWEPACGEGHIAEVLREYCPHVHATDIHGYGYGDGGRDFLAETGATAPIDDWIVTNPPFGDKALAFVHQALKLAGEGVAMFFRSQWAVEGIERYETIFRDHPPTLCAFFVERVPLCKGCWDPEGTTATAYCWLVWIKGEKSWPPFWIPPGRRAALTKPDDEERFTAHPVIRKAHVIAEDVTIDCMTGEILDPESEPAAPFPPPDGAAEEPAAVHPTDFPPPAASSSPDGDIGDIPSFLRPGSPDDYRRGPS
jgi:hypothetical protein